ncbi:MAG: class I SAM-dependent methyltransferase [Candidatus Brocadiia bacterium]
MIERRLRSLRDGAGRTAIDVPAGAGKMSAILMGLGWKVLPFDLFPEYFTAPGLTCVKADMEQGLPLPDASADLIVCQEGIEHIPNQLALLREFNRILKPGGKLLITTPNISSLQAKCSNFFMESDVFRRHEPSPLDALWLGDDERFYYGHLFLISAQKLGLLAKINGFRLVGFHRSRISWRSVFLGVLYPLSALLNLYAVAYSGWRNRRLGSSYAWAVGWEMMKTNLNPKVIFQKHMFAEFDKCSTPVEAMRELNQNAREEIGKYLGK